MLNNGKHRDKAALFLAVVLCSLLTLPPTFALTSSTVVYQKPQLQSTVQQMLKKGIFYYEQNDTSDIAAKYFKQVIASYPTSNEAEDAQYYLGSYYQRKYYITKEKWRKDVPSSLYSAESAYKEYINKYTRKGTQRWLSDARFYISLIYMQLRNFASAADELKRITLFETAQDPLIYVYQLAWSPDQQEVIDNEFNAKELAEYAWSKVVLYGSSGEIDRVIASLKRWCQSHRSEKASAR